MYVNREEYLDRVEIPIRLHSDYRESLRRLDVYDTLEEDEMRNVELKSRLGEYWDMVENCEEFYEGLVSWYTETFEK